MILFFNNSPGAFTQDSIQTGIEKITKAVAETLASQRLSSKEWDGDQIKVENQLPAWIQTLYEESPSNAPVIDFFKSYYRWLFTENAQIGEGYGLGFYLENIRDPFYMPTFMFQAYADTIFYDQLNFEEYPELLDNFKTFFVNYYEKYVPIRGTPDALAYILKSLFNCSVESITSTAATITIISTLDKQYFDLFKRLACPYSFNVNFEQP